MTNATTFPARGRVVEQRGNLIVLNPIGTNYEMHLARPTAAPALVGHRIEGAIRAAARKVWTVPSGGNFVTPIFGPPRIVQGRIRHLDEKQMVVHAGTCFVIDLPAEDTAYDLVNGPLVEGALVNATLQPGATFEAG